MTCIELLAYTPGLAGQDEARELGERLLQLHKDYRPRSMLQTPEHPVSRARFPVADVHCHWNAEVAPEALVADMDQLGIAYAVNLSGGWGDPLDAVLQRYKQFAPDHFEVLVNIDWANPLVCILPVLVAAIIMTIAYNRRFALGLGAIMAALIDEAKRRGLGTQLVRLAGRTVVGGEPDAPA